MISDCTQSEVELVILWKLFVLFLVTLQVVILTIILFMLISNERQRKFMDSMLSEYAGYKFEKDWKGLLAMAIQNGYLFSEDMTIEILSWLPVKTLLRFKCVSKPWYTIITSSSFISKHLNNYYNKSNRGFLLVRYSVYPYSQDLVELFSDEALADLSHQALDLPIPGASICGPCNGIFYIDCGDFCDSALWNPATKELKILPKKITLPNLPPDDYFNGYGFGLDLATNDFKVVVIQQHWDEEGMHQYRPFPVIVYTLGTDCWRYWGDLEEDYCTVGAYNTYLNGVFYWFGSYGDCNVILSFDMTAEKFQEIQAPDYDKPSFQTLSLYHGMVAVFTLHAIEKFLDIWTMDGGCWTKTITVGPFLGIRYPYKYWKNDMLFLESDTDQLLLCDLNTQELSHVFQGPGACRGVFVYKDSLVSILDRTGYNQLEELS